MIDILYEDNHLMIVNKKAGEIVQGDKTGDEPLAEKIKKHIKKRDNKPGNVFLGVVHRLDRPVSGAIIFAKTSKAHSRLSQMFKDKTIKKTYWAITTERPEKLNGELKHYMKKNQEQNKSYCYPKEVKNSKLAVLTYELVGATNNYFLLKVNLKTGRHHQIRSQLSKINCPIKGDLKYGAKHPNKDGCINLHAGEIEFIHPVKKEKIQIKAPPPANDSLWQELKKLQ